MSLNDKRLYSLAKAHGYKSTTDMLTAASARGIAPALCENEGCNRLAEMEPDQTAGWCDQCNKNTMVSCLVIAGICL